MSPHLQIAILSVSLITPNAQLVLQDILFKLQLRHALIIVEQLFQDALLVLRIQEWHQISIVILVQGIRYLK